MIKKLFNLVKNYDMIMMMLEDYKATKVIEKPKNKRYSIIGVPKDQLEYIEKKKKGV